MPVQIGDVSRRSVKHHRAETAILKWHLFGAGFDNSQAALARDLGYRIAEVPVHHNPRKFGRSKYGLERFARGAIDVGTMVFLYRYVNRPIHFFGFLSLLMMFLGFVGIVGGFVVLFFAESPVWTATLLVDGVTLFVGGGLVLGIGLLWELVLHFFVPVNVGVYIIEEPAERPKDPKAAGTDKGSDHAE